MEKHFLFLNTKTSHCTDVDSFSINLWIQCYPTWQEGSHFTSHVSVLPWIFTDEWIVTILPNEELKLKQNENNGILKDFLGVNKCHS